MRRCFTIIAMSAIQFLVWARIANSEPISVLIPETDDVFMEISNIVPVNKNVVVAQILTRNTSAEPICVSIPHLHFPQPSIFRAKDNAWITISHWTSEEIRLRNGFYSNQNTTSVKRFFPTESHVELVLVNLSTKEVAVPESNIGEETIWKEPVESRNQLSPTDLYYLSFNVKILECDDTLPGDYFEISDEELLEQLENNTGQIVLLKSNDFRFPK